MTEKILVTGGAGFIGSHTVNDLIERGSQVRVYDNLNPKVHGQDASKPEILHADAEFFQGDIRDRSHLKKALEGVKQVIHLAAEVGSVESMYSVDQYISTNVQGTGVLWDILVKDRHQVEKVFVASSMSVYGEGNYFCICHGYLSAQPRSEEDLESGRWDILCPDCDWPAEPKPTSENQELNATNIYAKTKIDQELYSQMIGKSYGTPTVIARYFNCYGPHQALNNPYSRNSGLYLSSIRSNQSPLIYEDGQQKTDMIHIDDLVRGTLLLLDHPDAKSGAFNIGSGIPTSAIEVAETLIKLCLKDLTPQVTHKHINNNTRHCIADISKIRALGYEPRGGLQQGLQTLAEWGTQKYSLSFRETSHHLMMANNLPH